VWFACRAARLKAYVKKIEEWLNLTPAFARLFRTLFWALVVTHLTGSLWCVGTGAVLRFMSRG